MSVAMNQWFWLVLLTITIGKGLSFSWTMQQAGVAMAKDDPFKTDPVVYQNSITPLWLSRTTIVIWLATMAMIVSIWYSTGWKDGVAASLTALIAPFVFQVVLPYRRGNVIYLRLAYHKLINRAADYARDGDLQREKAAATAASFLVEAYPGIVPRLDRP